ncbi:hypothetical protein ACIBSV_07100 [Embleya sp. NPDC050154]|uniref:hypothetical protein n=1 Tax=Embleya sp. NPDC050154 TaxID=3363988 RepID=UPI0037B9859C
MNLDAGVVASRAGRVSRARRVDGIRVGPFREPSVRRAATMFAAFAATGAITLTVPACAAAAKGTIVFLDTGRVVNNPGGCYNAKAMPLAVANRTSEYVLIYSGPDCTGNPVRVVPPGGRATEEFGSSLYVD